MSQGKPIGAWVRRSRQPPTSRHHGIMLNTSQSAPEAGLELLKLCLLRLTAASPSSLFESQTLKDAKMLLVPAPQLKSLTVEPPECLRA